MRCHVAGRASAVATTVRGPSVYAIASHPFWLIECGVFNTTTTAFAAAIARFTATGTQGAALTEITADDDAYSPVSTGFNTHTADATATAAYAQASIGAAIGAGVIWTFGKNGIKVPAATTNGIGVICPTGTGQVFDFYYVWEE